MTIKDISEALNISISTVSKALNNATDIAEDTKTRIKQYAESVGYHVKSKNTPIKRICILYERIDTDTRNNVFGNIVSSFADMAIANNYEVVIDYIESKSENFSLNDYLKQNNFSAAFVLGLNLKSKVYKQLKTTEKPIVLLDNHISDANSVSTISSDNTNAIVDAVHYLTQKGHKKIGLLLGEKQSLVSCERMAGYVLGLALEGIELNYNYIQYGDFSKFSGELAAANFAETDVTAIICCSDMMAMGLIDGLTSCGKSVPNDVSVMGFDDLSLLKFTSYNLTTMKQDFPKLGEEAFKQVCELLAGRKPQYLTIGCKLIERGTVKKLD